MQLNRGLLKSAADKGILTGEQSDLLWKFLTEQGADTASFKVTHILYYLGGMIAIGAMSLFMNLGWERFGGWGLFFIAFGYAMAGLWLTEYFLRRSGLTIPAGIMATFVVVLTPLAVYGLQSAFGFWVEGPGAHAYRDYHIFIDWRWIIMEFSTLAIAAIMLWRYRFPFLAMPVAVTLWYMSMDLTPFLFGANDYSWELRKFVSVGFGLLMVLLAFWIDIRTRRNKDNKDFAFWIYLFGTIAFWGGLSMMNSDSELNKFIYFCINLTMIAIGAMLSRRVFAVFGGLGVAGYIAHLSHDIFKDSMLFPVALTALGLGVIFVGVLWQRHEDALGRALRGVLPRELRELIERGQYAA